MRHDMIMFPYWDERIGKLVYKELHYQFSMKNGVVDAVFNSLGFSVDRNSEVFETLSKRHNS